MRLSDNLVKYSGVIQFEPDHITKKHHLQGEWKRTAMIMLDGDITEYYAWFIKKRFHLTLNKPIRGPHITFINDRFSDIQIPYSSIYDKVHNSLKPYLNNPEYEREKWAELYDLKLQEIANEEKEILWKEVKNKLDGKVIDVVLNTDVRTNSKTWWLNVDSEHRESIHAIRYELGLNRPYFGLHMTIGSVNANNIHLSNQIHEYIKNGLNW